MQYTAEETYTPTEHSEDRTRKEVKFETNETQRLAIAVVGLAALGWSGEEIIIAADEVANQAAYYNDLAARYPVDDSDPHRITSGDLYRITGHHGDYDVEVYQA